MNHFHKILISWFKQNKRNLPWRKTSNPYFIWISEIILQQTRIEQGIHWYFRFIDRFPDIKSLAQSSEEDVLLIWQGLGYYSRARNMHKAARQVMEQYHGEFPGSYDQIKKLKGVGEYTASAVASIAYGLPHAVLDGNVFRVLSRVFGISTPINSSSGKIEFSRIADSLLDRDNPGTYNEAIMEFGALQCKPSNPHCSECPLKDQCYAFRNHEVESLPVKTKKTSVQNRYFNFLFITCKGQLYIQKRSEKDIWENLYQLPLIETKEDSEDYEVISSFSFKEIFNDNKPVINCISPKITHLLSHQKLHIRFFKMNLEEPLPGNKYMLVPLSGISSFPFPKPLNNYLIKELKKDG
jgi:A/G-specific adenine glycosylase